jgi:hypothetical protein
MRKSTDTSRIALGDLNHYWTIEDEREFKRMYMDHTAEELAEHFNRDKYEVAAMALELTRQRELMEERERAEKLEYTRLGHLKHNPLYHIERGLKWTVEDLIYLCKYHDKDDLHSISLALGRTAKTCASQISNLRASGMYNHYRNWEEIS